MSTPEPETIPEAPSRGEAERGQLEARIAELEAELNRLRSAPATASTEVELDDHRVLQEVGI